MSRPTYMLDGLMTAETFLEIKRRDCYQSLEYEGLWTDLHTVAFEGEFWMQVHKAYSKLINYNYGFEIDQMGGI